MSDQKHSLAIYFNIELSKYVQHSLLCNLLSHSQIRVNLIITSRHFVFENAKNRFEKSLAFWNGYHLLSFSECSSKDQIVKCCELYKRKSISLVFTAANMH